MTTENPPLTQKFGNETAPPVVLHPFLDIPSHEWDDVPTTDPQPAPIASGCHIG